MLDFLGRNEQASFYPLLCSVYGSLARESRGCPVRCRGRCVQREPLSGWPLAAWVIFSGHRGRSRGGEEERLLKLGVKIQDFNIMTLI